MTPLPPTLRRRPLVETLLCVVATAFVAGCASGSYDTDNPDWAQSGTPPPPKVTSSGGEWIETEVPPPPAFSTTGLTSVTMPPYMSVRFGVDMKTVTITPDGVVRYVVVGSSRTGDAVNVFYEGIRCAAHEVKTYARHSNGSWQIAKDAEWKRFIGNNSSHARALAAQGLCRGNAPRASVSDMVEQFRNPNRELY